MKSVAMMALEVGIEPEVAMEMTALEFKKAVEAHQNIRDAQKLAEHAESTARLVAAQPRWGRRR